MSIINIQTVQSGLVGVLPSLAYIDTSSTEAAALTTGFLNKEVANGVQFSLPCIAAVSTQETPTAAKRVGWYQVAHVGADWSLIPAGNPGDVTLPTIANHIATYTNTTGTLSEDAATAINGGNIQAGLSGTAGYLASFPSTAARGSLRVTAVANTGDTLVTISNALHGQASVYSIPDSGASTANFIISKLTGTQHITIGGLQVDAGALISGLSTGGFVGKIQLFPTTTTTGSLTLQATPAAGNFASTITNAAFAQAVAFTIPDPGAASASFVLSTSSGGQSIAGGLTVSTGNITATAGNLVAGSSGAAGTVSSFPATAANGSLLLAAVNAGGAFNTTISNGAMGQSTVYTMGDIGAATGGLVVATSAIRMKSVAGAAAAGGNAAQSFTDAFCTSGSNVVGNWNTQANAASVLTIVPGNGSFVVTSTADAGVGTFNYIITK
jgi:hypothetical protein